MEREVGGGIGMGNTCKSMADSFQCMTKPTTIKFKKKKKRVFRYPQPGMEMGMATHSSIAAWRIPRPEEPGRYSPRGSQGVRHD